MWYSATICKACGRRTWIRTRVVPFAVCCGGLPKWTSSRSARRWWTSATRSTRTPEHAAGLPPALHAHGAAARAEPAAETAGHPMAGPPRRRGARRSSSASRLRASRRGGVPEQRLSEHPPWETAGFVGGRKSASHHESPDTRLSSGCELGRQQTQCSSDYICFALRLFASGKGPRPLLCLCQNACVPVPE